MIINIHRKHNTDVINLDKSIEPLKTIAASTLLFNKLILGEGVIIQQANLLQTPCFNHLEELDLQAEHLLSTTDITINSSHELLRNAPNLKRLTMRNCPQEDFEDYYLFNQTTIQKIIAGEVLQQLEILIIILEETWSICMINFFEPLRQICTSLPNLKVLTLERMAEDNNDEVLQFVRAISNLQVNVEFIAKFSRVIQRYLVTDYSDEDYQKIERCYGDKYWAFYWKNTTSMKLLCVDNKWQDVDNEWQVKNLEHMTHLKELNLYITGCSCFYGHKMRVNRVVQVLDILCSRVPCVECLTTIGNSFPNCKKFVYEFSGDVDVGYMTFNKSTKKIKHANDYQIF